MNIKNRRNRKRLFMNRKLWSSSFVSILSFSFCAHLLFFNFSSLSSYLSIRSHFQTFMNYKRSLIPQVLILVKRRVILLLIFSNSLVMANSTIYLAKGQQYIINFNNLSHFSLGNEQVLKVKYIKKESRLYIKGKMVGFSDLKVFTKNKKTFEYKIFVLSKTKHMAQYQLAESLELLGLETKVYGSVLVPRGVISSVQDYITLSSLKQGQKNLVLSNIRLEKSIRNKIFARVYQALINEGIDYIKCSESNLSISCSVSPFDSESHVVKNLEQSLFIQFNSNSTRQNNYSIKLRLIKVEYAKDRNLDWQLGQIDQQLSQLINQGLISKKNKIFLKETKTSLSVVGEPTLLTEINKNSTISFGSEIPFQSQFQNATNIQWKFAGIKLNSTLKKINHNLHLNYNINFTSPSNNNQVISGSKQSGSLIVNLNKNIQLFKIGFYVDSDSKSSIPLLNSFPLLKSIFSSYEKNHLFQEILGILIIQHKKA